MVLDARLYKSMYRDVTNGDGTTADAIGPKSIVFLGRFRDRLHAFDARLHQDEPPVSRRADWTGTTRGRFAGQVRP